jgi:hypothetical protein
MANPHDIGVYVHPRWRHTKAVRAHTRSSPQCLPWTHRTLERARRAGGRKRIGLNSCSGAALWGLIGAGVAKCVWSGRAPWATSAGGYVVSRLEELASEPQVRRELSSDHVKLAGGTRVPSCNWRESVNVARRDRVGVHDASGIAGHGRVRSKCSSRSGARHDRPDRSARRSR